MDQFNKHTEMSSSMKGIPDDELCQPPREELEQAIAQVWKDVFRLEQIGPDDNFFELGGNSLLGMDLTEMLASRFAIEVPVLVLFQHPTIREMTEIVTTAHRV